MKVFYVLSNMIEEIFSNIFFLYNLVGVKVFVVEIGYGEDDVVGEYLFCDLEWDELSWFDLGRLFVECNELVCCEIIDSVYR